MQKFGFAVRAAAMAAVFALIAGSSLQAQDEGGRGRGGRGGGQRGQRGGGQRGGGQRGGGGFGGGGQRGFGGGGQRGFGGFGGGTQTARTTSKAQLLAMEEVQKELKLEGDTLEFVKAAVDGYNEDRRKIQGTGRGGRGGTTGFDREKYADMDDDEKAEYLAEFRKKAEETRKEADKKTKELDEKTDGILATFLEEEQWSRLGQIQVQSTLRNGLQAALMDKDFAAKMKLTKEQSKKLEEMKEASDKANTEAGEKMREMFQGGDRSNLREMFTEMREKAAERTKANEKKIDEMMTADQKTALKDMQGEKFEFPERNRGRGGRGAGGAAGGGRGGRGGRPGGGGDGGGGSGRPARPGGGGGDDGGI